MKCAHAEIADLENESGDISTFAAIEAEAEVREIAGLRE